MAWMDRSFWEWGFFISEWVIRLAMLVVVPFRRTPAAAKGWLLLIMFEPWIGLLIYVLIGRARLSRRQREQLAKLPDAMAKVISRLLKHPHTFHPELGPTLSQAVLLAENLGQSPILGGNAVELLVDYEATFARMIADIDEAKHHVHLLFYILADDAASAPVFEALERPPDGAFVVACLPMPLVRLPGCALCGRSSKQWALKFMHRCRSNSSLGKNRDSTCGIIARSSSSTGGSVTRGRKIWWLPNFRKASPTKS